MYERFRESHTNEIEIQFYRVVEKKKESHSVFIKIYSNILDVIYSRNIKSKLRYAQNEESLVLNNFHVRFSSFL